MEVKTRGFRTTTISTTIPRSLAKKIGLQACDKVLFSDQYFTVPFIKSIAVQELFLNSVSPRFQPPPVLSPSQVHSNVLMNTGANNLLKGATSELSKEVRFRQHAKKPRLTDKILCSDDMKSTEEELLFSASKK